MQTDESSQIPRIVEAIEKLEVKEAEDTADEVKEPLEAKGGVGKVKEAVRKQPGQRRCAGQPRPSRRSRRSTFSRRMSSSKRLNSSRRAKSTATPFVKTVETFMLIVIIEKFVSIEAIHSDSDQGTAWSRK